MAASKNKWAGDWASYWFYHKVPLDPTMKCHPLVTKRITNLGDTPKVDVDRVPANEAYLSILREVLKVFEVHDITEEFVACGCFPMRDGWIVSSWALEEKQVCELPMPDFSKVFGLHKEHEFFLAKS